MKITLEDYKEFIESMTSEQLADLCILVNDRIKPFDQLRIEHANAVRMSNVTATTTTHRRTFTDGTKIVTQADGTAIYNGDCAPNPTKEN